MESKSVFGMGGERLGEPYLLGVRVAAVGAAADSTEHRRLKPGGRP
jgi:hypothetical protein